MLCCLINIWKSISSINNIEKKKMDSDITSTLVCPTLCLDLLQSWRPSFYHMRVLQQLRHWKVSIKKVIQQQPQQSQTKKEVIVLWLCGGLEVELPQIPPWPSSLTVLRIDDVQFLGANLLPATLTVLDIQFNEALVGISDGVLPESLLEFILGCFYLRQLPSTLPLRLEVLNCNSTDLDQYQFLWAATSVMQI